MNASLDSILAAGAVPTVYGGGPLSRGLATSLPMIGPGVRAVSLHASVPASGTFTPGTLYADSTLPSASAALRAARPGAELWVGIGVDAVARRVRSGAWTRQQGVSTFVGLARGAAEQGAKIVVWDGEPQYKFSDAATRDVLTGLVTESLAAVARSVPRIVQGHTSYGNVVPVRLANGQSWGGHGDYVWPAWIGPSSPVAITFPQVYPSISNPVGPGVVQEWMRRAGVSYGAAVERGMVGRQVAVRPYLLLHGAPAADTVAVANQAGTSMLWALPGTVDADGREAVAQLTGGDPPGADWGIREALAFGGLGALVAAGVRWWRRNQQ